MTKLHFEDLTQITCPFGMLDDDTQRKLDNHAAAGGEVEIWRDYGWSLCKYINWDEYLTYRAKPKPKRLVTWLQWDDDDEALCCEDRHEADHCLKLYGGYIYRIERDEDGSNPAIELVEVGGKDE